MVLYRSRERHMVTPNHAFERTRINVVGMGVMPVVCSRLRARRSTLR